MFELLLIYGFDLVCIHCVNRENELLDEREARLQQQAEKEQQYDQLCKNMKDRVSNETKNR